MVILALAAGALLLIRMGKTKANIGTCFLYLVDPGGAGGAGQLGLNGDRD